MRVKGLGLRVLGLGLRVKGLGFRVEGFGFRVDLGLENLREKIIIWGGAQDSCQGLDNYTPWGLITWTLWGGNYYFEHFIDIRSLCGTWDPS